MSELCTRLLWLLVDLHRQGLLVRGVGALTLRRGKGKRKRSDKREAFWKWHSKSTDLTSVKKSGKRVLEMALKEHRPEPLARTREKEGFEDGTQRAPTSIRHKGLTREKGLHLQKEA